MQEQQQTQSLQEAFQTEQTEESPKATTTTSTKAQTPTQNLPIESRSTTATRLASVRQLEHLQKAREAKKKIKEEREKLLATTKGVVEGLGEQVDNLNSEIKVLKSLQEQSSSKPVFERQGGFKRKREIDEDEDDDETRWTGVTSRLPSRGQNAPLATKNIKGVSTGVMGGVVCSTLISLAGIVAALSAKKFGTASAETPTDLSDKIVIASE